MYQILENNLENICNDKYLIQTQSQAKSSGIKLQEGPWCKEKFRSQSKTRKTAYLSQTRKFEEAMNRSGESQIKEEET